MPSDSTLRRRRQKEENPELYNAYLERQRQAYKKRSAEKKRKWEEEPHTRAQIEEYNAKIEARRATERARYRNKNSGCQTRTSSVTVTPTRKKPKDMTSDELREYQSAQRRRQRDALSHQKRTAIRIKEKERKRLKRLSDRYPNGAIGNGTPLDSKQLRQSIHNLNHDYKTSADRLGLTSTEYARATLNLVNPRTPDKRVALKMEQRSHPCRSLFQSEEGAKNFYMEEELGITIEDDPFLGPAHQETVTKPLHDKIKLFYYRDDVSRLLPHARYTSKHGPARVMLQTLKAAHVRFRDENPLDSIGLTSFQGLRPRNVRLLGSVPVESCLCIYCTNVRLKLNALNKLLGSSGQLPGETAMLGFLTCPYSGRWPDIKCIDGKCSQCKDRMRPFHIFCRDIYSINGVKWQRWEKSQEGKMEPSPKEGSVRDLLSELQRDIDPPNKTSFCQHLFTAFWEYQQFKACKTNPEEGEVVMIQDFGENRKAAYSDEIKSAHFGKRQITVHPVVCFYRQGEQIVRDSFIFLSDDICHDHHAVKEFTRQTLQLLKTRMVVTKVTIWSDGASSQYKGKGTLHDMLLMSEYTVQRCYFGSEHGKGEADGETGVMSQALKRAVYGGFSFSSAKDMVEFLNSNCGKDSLSGRRLYVLVSTIDRVEVDAQTIPGTRSYHQFLRLGPFMLGARRLACFCCACREGTEQSFLKCVNQDIVDRYTIHKLKPSITTTLNDAFLEEPSCSSPAGAPCCASTSSEQPKPKVGQFIKLDCQINRVHKIFYAVVIESPSDGDFSVRFLQRSGMRYVFGDCEDVGLITSGPPDFYEWTIMEGDDVNIDNRGHYTFRV